MTMIFAGGAAAIALALSGCSAGLNSQTAAQVPVVPGTNVTVAGPGGQGTVSVRDVQIAYPGVDGYQAGSSAPLLIRIFNDTSAEVEVTITSQAGGVALTSAPTASPEPSPKADGPVKVKVPANGFVILDPAVSKEYAQLTGLKQALSTNSSVPVKFDFGGGAVIEVPVPVTVPLSANPRDKATFGSEGH